MHDRQTIIGRDNPEVDVQALQAASSHGGEILLKGVFNFGDRGRMNITRDVKIVGERDNGGKPITKIKGGYWTFHSPLPTILPPKDPGPKIMIQSIHFDGALWAPVFLAYCNGAAISNNKITNVRPKPLDGPIFGTFGLNRQQGIVCAPYYAQPEENRKYIPDAFTGFLEIEGNDIDLTNNAATKTMAQGVIVVRTTGITARIQRNTVMNCARNSLEALDNFLGKDGSGMILIRDNKIVNSVEGVPVPTPETPNGIVVGWFLDISGGLDPQRSIRYIVTNNVIRTRGKSSIGIAAFTNGVVVVNNALSSEGKESIPLFVTSSDGYIAYNKMEGTSSRPAILIRPWEPLKASKNVFEDNDLSQFKSSAEDVLFEKYTCNNLFMGPSCKVKDLGSNNSIQMTRMTQ
jgi:hypothetical protein